MKLKSIKKNKATRYTLHATRSGFTLIEAVVSTALFAFVVSSILGVYVSTLQLDRKTRSQRAVAQNARFITEFLSKEITNGTIDYSVARNNDLYLINQSNVSERFYLNGTDLIFNPTGYSANLNSSSVKVTNLKIYVAPAGDPYTAAKNYNEQPHVTILLELTSNYSNKPSDIAKLDLETTFSTRAYPSRQ